MAKQSPWGYSTTIHRPCCVCTMKSRSYFGTEDAFVQIRVFSVCFGTIINIIYSRKYELLLCRSGSSPNTNCRWILHKTPNLHCNYYWYDWRYCSRVECVCVRFAHFLLVMGTTSVQYRCPTYLFSSCDWWHSLLARQLSICWPPLSITTITFKVFINITSLLSRCYT